MSSIFVSHNSRDDQAAKALGNWLKGQGHTSYFLDFDPDNGSVAGKHWESELYRHLRLCRVVIALVSSNWLSSKWCFAEVTHARSAGKPVFIVKIAPCATDSLFNDVQHIDFTIDPTEGHRRLARGLKELGIEPGDVFTWDQSRPPYPGLLAFEEADAAIFFGRTREVQKGLEVLEGLRHRVGPSFVLCLGASGSGKSSLLRAGLIPRLRKSRARWLPVAPFRPQENPMEELAIQLASALELYGERQDWRPIYEQLFFPANSHDWDAESTKQTISGDGLRELTRDLRVLAKQHDSTVLLAIDQAEELFGYSNARMARAFLQCLRGALEGGGDRLMAIATMRSDAFGSFQVHPILQEFAYEPLAIDPIPPRDLPQIIEGPAHRADITLEPGLAQMLVHDATTGDALPLLAFTMRELYERYGKQCRLRIRDYSDIGGIDGSVRRAADEVMARTNPNQEEIDALRIAFVPGMVGVNDKGDFIRRRASWHDIPARAHRLLNAFIAARLLVSRGEGGDRIVEVAHEALLRVWPRLESWLRDDRDNLRLFDDLRCAAEEWEAHSRVDSWLVHRGERLDAVERMLEFPQFVAQLDEVAQYYLSSCKEKRREEHARAEREALAERLRQQAEARATRRTRIAAFAIFAIIAVGAAIFGWYRAGVVEIQRNQALLGQSKLLSLLSRKKTDEGFATLGTLLALEALTERDGNRRPLDMNAEAALLYALFSQREHFVLTGHTDGVNKIRFSPDGALILTASRDGTARIWKAATGKTTTILNDHDGQVYDAEFSPDGKKVVTACAGGTARIWDSDTGKRIVILRGHAGDVYSARFSSDGKRVVTASSDRTARIWDVNSEQVIWSLKGHTGEVFSAEFSLDGRSVVTSSEDGTARLWHFGKQLGATKARVLGGHTAPVYYSTFSPDATRIGTASWDHTAMLWDVAREKVIHKLTGHKGGVGHVAFSPEGSLLVTSSADGTARLWSGVTGRHVASLEEHKGQIYDAQFSLDGQWLVTAADDGIAKLWDVDARKSVDTFRGHDARVWSAHFSPDGQYIATASEDNTARLWKGPNSNSITLKGHNANVHRAIFSPNGGRLVTISDDHTVRLWEVDTGRQTAVLTEHEGEVWYAAFSNRGQLLVTTSTDGTARLWDMSIGRLVHTLRGHEGLVNHAHFSPDGQQLVTGAKEGTARIWNVASGKTISVLHGHRGPVNFAEYSPDGQRILTASQDGTARLWKVATGELVAVLEGHRGPVINGAFSADGSRLSTSSWDRTVRIWDAASGKSLSTLEGHSDTVWSATFSRDGKRIVTSSSDNSARVWDAESSKLLYVLGHDGEVKEASFSPDGRLVLTASADGTARLWHTNSGFLVAAFRAHSGPVVGAAFSPDGRRLATASWDHTARLWRLPVSTGDDWIRYAKETVPRKLSPEERRLYVQQ